MSIYETETVTTRSRPIHREEPYRAFHIEPLEFAAIGVALIMTLGPLFAYAVGLGP